MITPEELRIGNYVGVTDLPYIQLFIVKRIYGDDDMLTVQVPGEDGFVYRKYDNITGIPLTEDWLKRLGFEWFDENSCYRKAKTDWYITDGRVKSYTFPHIQYVHSLQNLFYALTGKELTAIKLNK